MDPITFTFSENSNYWRESVLEVIRQKIARWCQQTCCFQKFVDNAQQCFALHLKQTFPPIIWTFTEDEGDRIESRLPFEIFSTLSGKHSKYMQRLIVKKLSRKISFKYATMASPLRALFLSAFNLMTFKNYLVLHQIATMHNVHIHMIYIT